MKEFTLDKDANSLQVSNEMLQHFKDKGFIIVRSLLVKDEIENLMKTMENDECFKAFCHSRDDGSGQKAKLVLWFASGNDVTDVIARSEKVAGTMDLLLGGEVYHYHSKIIMKDARTGGMFVWHQDYGYWYDNGFLFPDMGTVFIAADRAHKENGCLKIIEGSHKMGRLEHEVIGEQTGISDERMSHILERNKVTHVELEPGDALFFHCNLIHKSDQNRSDDRRWALLCAYNRADNNPVREDYYTRYSKLEKVANAEIANCKQKVNPEEKNFFQLCNDFREKELNANSKK